jgi:putative ABC transport system permease protein
LAKTKHLQLAQGLHAQYWISVSCLRRIAVSHFIQDFRFALRQMRRSPGFVLTAVTTLALGVGANTAVYSLLDQALLRSLPVQKPEQLVVLSAPGKAWNGHTGDHGAGEDKSFSYPMYRDLRDQAKVFSGLIATSPASVGIAHDRTSEVADAEIVSGNYFSVLGVKPALGRLLLPSDDTAPGTNPMLDLSHRYWATHLGADPNIAGKTITVNGHSFQVIGVAPESFQSAVWGETPDLFVPMSMLDVVIPGKGKRLTDHTDRWMNVIGRLRDGETIPQAEAGVAPLWHALRAQELKDQGRSNEPRFVDEFLTHSRLIIEPGARGLSYSRSSLETPLLAVMAMAALVLLLAAVNIASLLLVRAASRVQEFAVRYAMGARSARILQQLLIEGALIGLLGGAAGMLLAPAAMRLLVRQIAPDGNTAFHATLDARLFLIGLAVALAVSLLFSLAPAIQLLRPDLVTALKQKAATASGGALGLRRIVVSLQIGLSVLLLIGAGLFVRTIQNLRNVNAGFNTTHLITFRIDPPLAGYTKEQTLPIEKHLEQTLAALPGIQAVAATDDPELTWDSHTGNVTVKGYVAAPNESYDVEKSKANGDFFHALQVPMAAGRSFTDADDTASQPVAIVNETFARHYFRNAQAAIGGLVADGAGKDLHFMTIVGVARDMKHVDLREKALPTLFTPLGQGNPPEHLYFYLRTAMPPERMFTTVRTSVRNLDPALIVGELRTMDEQVEQNISNERMIEVLALAFGALAALLAGVGLYGVLSYTTVQRTREIGIRMALGSSRLAITGLVVKEMARLAIIGVAVAVPCAILLGRTLRSQLFGVSAADPVTLIGVVLLMALVGILAALIPARRAAKVEPMEALRAE